MTARSAWNPTAAAALAALSLLLAGVSGCTRGAVRHSPTAKPDSQLARDARRADALGLTPTATLSTGYNAKVDLARAMSEGEDQVGIRAPRASGAPPPAGSDAQWLAAALLRNKGTIEDAWEEGKHQASFIQPVEDARLRLLYVDQTIHTYNDQGRDYHDGFNLYFSDRVAIRVAQGLVLTAEPEFSFLQDKYATDGDSDIQLQFQELSASGRLGPLELSVGRMSLWWGPGRHGALLMSDNAVPLDMVKLSTAGPVLLPGFLSYLGLLRGEIFASQLEADRQVPRPILAGARLTSRLMPWLEAGISRTAMFGGTDQPPVTCKTLQEIFIGNDNGPDNPSDQKGAIDARIIIPWEVQPFEVYGEYGGEDEAGSFFSKTAYLTGIYLPRVGPWKQLELVVEYADLVIPKEQPRIWYTHSVYVDGYTRHGRIMGHHVGTDGLDIFGELRVRPWGDEKTIFFSYDYEEHLRLDPVVERLHQVRMGIDVRIWRNLWSSLSYELDFWENFQQEKGREETGSAIALGARWEF